MDAPTPPSIGARIGARFLDGFAVAIGSALVRVAVDARGVLVALVVAVLYETIAVAGWGATAGKVLLHIEVVDDSTLGRVRPWQAAVRALTVLVPIHLVAPRVDSVAEWLIVLVLLANVCTVATRRDDRRGLHDLAAGTRPVSSGS